MWNGATPLNEFAEDRDLDLKEQTREMECPPLDRQSKHEPGSNMCCSISEQTKCGNEYENGQDCPPPPETVAWMNTQTKLCPNCAMPIEKNVGCDHMHCEHPGGCGFHFAWINKQTKPCPNCAMPIEKNGGCAIWIACLLEAAGFISTTARANHTTVDLLSI